jgi:hypothetical protein
MILHKDKAFRIAAKNISGRSKPPGNGAKFSRLENKFLRAEKKIFQAGK